MKKFMEKAKGVAQTVNAKACVMAATAASVLAGAACAEDATTATVTTAMQTGFTQIATDALNVIAIIVPIALGIAGMVFISRKAISWFKGLAK